MQRPGMIFSRIEYVVAMFCNFLFQKSESKNIPTRSPSTLSTDLIKAELVTQLKLLRYRLLFLAVLESGAPLSSSLEEELYKCSV